MISYANDFPPNQLKNPEILINELKLNIQLEFEKEKKESDQSLIAIELSRQFARYMISIYNRNTNEIIQKDWKLAFKKSYEPDFSELKALLLLLGNFYARKESYSFHEQEFGKSLSNMANSLPSDKIKFSGERNNL